MFYSSEFYADISELNARMETVEGTVSDHDGRLSIIDANIEGKNIIFALNIELDFLNRNIE